MLFWAGILVSAIISTVLSLLFTDQIKGLFSGLFIKIGFSKGVNLNGIWKCSFVYNGKTYVEIVKIKQIGNRATGRIEPDSENYDALKKVMYNKPLRLTGIITGERYFTGYWYHPIETYRYHGAFQLIVRPDDRNAEGIWVGFSRTANRIESGKWILDKK